MRPIQIFVLAMIAAAAALTGGTEAVVAQAPAEIPPILITPDKVESRVGTLEFKDGAPSAETVQKVYDTLDFTRALDSYLNSYGGASAYAMCQGFASVGANDNSVVLFSELMDSNSLFLTANADTV